MPRSRLWITPRLLLTALVLAVTMAGITSAPVAAAAAVVREDLYLRDGPGTQHAILALMPAGAVVAVEGAAVAGWYPLRYGERAGWAYGAWLALDGPGGGGTRGGAILQVPFRTQWDGSAFEWGNCGVAGIGMMMAYHGRSWPTHTLRESINAMTGNYDRKVGVDWRYLARAVEQRGFGLLGPYDGRGGYRYWTLDDLLAQTAQGRPVMLLVHYRSLPGHADDEWPGDHYILFLGLTADGNVVYHDPGLRGDAGAYRVMDQATLDYAWSNTWIGQDRTAMVVLP